MQLQEIKPETTVGVAMSGGVDSSVTAILLKNKGCDVHGFFMALAQPDLDQQIERVRKVASHLAIPLTVVDLSAAFKQAVLDYFTRSYFEGKTPNPCVICNPTIKFGLLLDRILSSGCSYMASGHYARTIRGTDKIFHLLKGLDPLKDQSYFLHRLTQQQLSRITFPLGEVTKKHVYTLAAELGISGVHGTESQDVCFLKDTDVAGFLARNCSAADVSGRIINLDGQAIGVHNGIQRYTVGQRKGLGIPDATPYYVVALDPLENTVIVGKKHDLQKSSMTIGDISWVAGSQPGLPHDFTTRIRYRHEGAPATVTVAEHGHLHVRFQEPQAAITPGQFAVFYENDEVMGGGVIL